MSSQMQTCLRGVKKLFQLKWSLPKKSTFPFRPGLRVEYGSRMIRSEVCELFEANSFRGHFAIAFAATSQRHRL